MITIIAVFANKGFNSNCSNVIGNIVIKNTPHRIILGIDPGSRATGYGVIAIQNNQPVYITSGVVKATQPNVPERLRTIFTGMQTIIDTHQPTELAIEQVFVHQNPLGAIKLGQARGAAIAASFMHELSLHEYSARQIKQAVVGYGNAQKSQVSSMVMKLLGLGTAPQADAGDALACALCHYHSVGVKSRS